MEQIKVQIRIFLSRYFRKYELQDNEDIFGLGFVNSLFAMQLVMFIEQQFQLTVEDTDLDMDNFRSIQAIAEFIDKKQSEIQVFAERGVNP
ncbi:D-alanyl carrier protein [Paenibacillus dendritiformis]|uniref:acyl carrier protein n=1 Tax=Paenibacillus dendritiformis TaxID=130049 RepID=UPI0018CD98B0|nr:acyl carrier protein [Paenibacillus dendritiformis]MBG9793997.1 D-alanyl carrier protein [Paenibacillus dendritiformis]